MSLKQLWKESRGDFFGGIGSQVGYTLIAAAVAGIVASLWPPFRAFLSSVWSYLISPTEVPRLLLWMFALICVCNAVFLTKMLLNRRHEVDKSSYTGDDFVSELADYFRQYRKEVEAGMGSFRVVFADVDRKLKYPEGTTKRYIEAAARGRYIISDKGEYSCTLAPHIAF